MDEPITPDALAAGFVRVDDAFEDSKPIGKGVFARCALPEGITLTEARGTWRRAKPRDREYTLFVPRAQMFLLMRHSNHFTRLINCSSRDGDDANLRCVAVRDSGGAGRDSGWRVLFVTQHDIAEGEELRFFYGDDFVFGDA